MCYEVRLLQAPSFFFAFDYFDYGFKDGHYNTTLAMCLIKFIKDKDLNFGEDLGKKRNSFL